MFKISHYMARMYQDCPRKYYYEYVAKRKELKKPRANLAFGEIMHNVLRDFFRFRSEMRNEKTIQTLLNNYWRYYSHRAVGAMSDEEMKEYYAKAVKIIHDFLATQDLLAQPVLTEQMLEMPLDKDLVLIGKVDRADQEKDGTLSVLDYKTGKYIEEYEEVNQLQLMTYALLVQYLLKKKVSKTAFLYLESNQLVQGTPTPESLELAKATYQQIRQDIKRSEKSRNYPAYTGGHCPWCDYFPICKEAHAVGYTTEPVEDEGEEMRDI
jgi:CRISPR/Cas system-associated exonuclease Cas4 (RecB family)